MLCGINMSGIGQKWRFAGMSFRETDEGVRVYVKKASANSSGSRKKRLPYSFKQISQQIAKVKNASGARPVITQVRQKLGWLYTKLRSSDYDDEEIAAAIVHATAMEKIAKRKMKHLEEEEHAEKGGAVTSGEDEELFNEDSFAEEMALSDISEEMMEELLEQFAELMADEQENMIDLYLDRGTMFVLEESGSVKAECVVTDEGNGMLEIQNLAVEQEFQRNGYGKALIEFIADHFKNQFEVLQVGTGDSPLTVPFYEHCGFTRHHIIPNYIVDHYDHPIFEGGKQLIDKVYLWMKL